MQNTNTPEKHKQGADNMRSAEELTTQARNRRRILLKGIGKSSAVLAATVPLKILAAPRLLTTDGLMCSTSGIQSGVQSATPSFSKTCAGYRPSHWTVEGNWPSIVLKNAEVSTVLKKSNTKSSLLDLMQSNASKVSSKKLAGEIFAASESTVGSSFSDEVHWVCAWLNATKLFGGEPGSTYPYNPDQVLVFYNELNRTKYDDALKFFTTHLENLG